jgi:hypothetical protein
MKHSVKAVDKMVMVLASNKYATCLTIGQWFPNLFDVMPYWFPPKSHVTT